MESESPDVTKESDDEEYDNMNEIPLSPNTDIDSERSMPTNYSETKKKSPENLSPANR